MTNSKLIESFDDFRLDFNQLSELLSSHNYKTRSSSNSLQEFILQSSYQIINVHNYKKFKDILEKIIKQYHLYGVPLEVDLFVSFTQGSCSIIHDDPYDVLIYGLHGETIYVVDKKKYSLKAGDIIIINEGEVHQGIGISPRIVLSLGIRKDKIVKNNLKNTNISEVKI